MYLYRINDLKGSTIDFCLKKIRDYKATKHFFKKTLRFFHVSKPRVITVDKNPIYFTKEKSIPNGMRLRQQKYLNNIVGQDNRFIKK